MINEIWKSVEEFNGLFEISNKGRLKRVLNSPNMPDNNILKGEITQHGYRQYHIKINGESFKRRAHRLVAQAFIENNKNLPQVNHIDGNKLNNNVENLEWCTQLENNRHALRTGLRQINLEQIRKAQKVSSEKQKKKVGQYNLNGELIKIFECLQDTEKCFKNSSNIGRVCSGKGKTAYGYKWKYI